MNAKTWEDLIGEEAYRYIAFGPAEHCVETTQYADEIDEATALLLTRAVEMGFRAPERQPIPSPQGTKVLMQNADGTVEPILTAEGLARHWRNRGHGFLLLRAEQLVKATAGPLLPWLQLIMGSYEEQCASDGVSTLAVDWRVFVGGQEEHLSSLVCDGDDPCEYLADRLERQSPEPDRGAVQRVTVRGSGSRP